MQHKTLVLVDMKPLLYSIFGGLSFNTNFPTGKDMMEHVEEVNGVKFNDIFLNTINEIRTQYPDYSHIVIFVMDARKDGIYWRNKILQEYKLNRDSISSLHQVITHFVEKLPELNFKYLQLPGCEADDIIASIVINYGTKFSKIIIHSKDKDFNQLVSGNIICTSCNEPISHETHLSMILGGDRADGIPNVLSDDDAIVNPDKRQNTLGRKLKETYIETIVSGNELTGNVLKNYVRNKRLMDLRCIPESIVNKIIVKFEEFINEIDVR